MNGVIGIGATIALLLLVGGGVGLLRRDVFRVRWLLIAAALVLINDMLLTRFYGLMPDLVPALHWNWQGKVIALCATLAIAALPAFGWRASGLRLRQETGSLLGAALACLLYCGFFIALALVFSGDAGSHEEIAFQLTMPGFEEEPFYRGILLLALDRAFVARWRFLGVDWGWGALFSCALFGMTHAFGYGADGFSFDPMIMGLTAIPSLLAVWLRLRTGSLLLPVLLHNFGNSISLLI